MRLVLLDQAKEDLANIAAYIAEKSKSRHVGQNLAQRLLDKCKELASTGVSRFFYEPMIQLSGILDYRDFFLSDKIVLISTLLTVGKKSKYIL
ncbi:MAG: hypothetical protein IPH22_13730 [Nitrosomonas sp.]|nr:hypothetical protein [Nitrosomonas sp.]